MPEQPVPPAAADDKPDTVEILAREFRLWKRKNPNGKWGQFWEAVRLGEVEVPSPDED